MNIIKDLKIREENYNFLNKEQEKLPSLSKVNIFIGENNSGKSRFLRSIFYKDDSKLKFIANDEQFEYYLKQRNQLLTDIHNEKNHDKTQSTKQLIDKKIEEDYIPSETYLTDSEYPFEKINEKYIKYKNNQQRDSYIALLNKYFKEIDFLDEDLFKYNFYKIYIPTLRGLLPFIPDKTISTSLSKHKHINKFVPEDVFGQRTKNDYFGKDSKILLDISDSLIKSIENTNNAIITGHYFYKYVQEFLLGNLQQREIIKEYQEYLSENFFQKQEVTLIPKLEDEVLTVKIGNDEEQKIYNLGEGIQSIILITLPLFLYLEKSKEKNTNILVFIEEPEIGLHPLLQRKLINTFLDKRFEDYQFFFTTHSNHFIDRTLEKEDISIYSFDKYLEDEENSVANFTIEKVGFDHYPTLKKLGALPSSVMASNCTILVEGSHDVTHYEFYLKLYQEKLKSEDQNFKPFENGIHYSFLRGGGDETMKTVMEFNEIEKERILTILDFDSKDKSEKNIEEFKRINYNNYEILSVREVENLISKDILIKILNSIREIRNLGITEDFDEKKYQESKFYKFIKTDIITGKIPENFFNKDTFKDRFSYKEQEFTESYDELSDTAKEITEKIYSFIEKNNTTGA